MYPQAHIVFVIEGGLSGIDGSMLEQSPGYARLPAWSICAQSMNSFFRVRSACFAFVRPVSRSFGLSMWTEC